MQRQRPHGGRGQHDSPAAGVLQLMAELQAARDPSVLAAKEQQVSNLCGWIMDATAEGEELQLGTPEARELLRLLEGEQLLLHVAGAVRTQLQLLCAQLPADGSVLPGNGDMLLVVVLLKALGACCGPWILSQPAASAARLAVANLQFEQLTDAGLIPALASAMAAAAAAVQRLVAEQREDDSSRRLVQLGTYLMTTWSCLQAGVDTLCLREPWAPSYVAYAQLSGALLQLMRLPAAEARAQPSAADSGSSRRTTSSTGSSSSGRQGGAQNPRNTTPQAWRVALDDAIEQVLCAALLLSGHIGIVVQYESSDARHMSLLGSDGLLEQVLVVQGTTALELHAVSRGASPAPDISSSCSSSGSRQRHVAVPDYHSGLLQAMHRSLPVLVAGCPRVVSCSGEPRTVRQPMMIARRKSDIQGLWHMLLGPETAPELQGAAVALWPPPPRVPCHLVLPLMRVLVELLALAPLVDTATMLQGLVLLHALQPKSAPAAGLVKPLLHVLGPVVLHAVDVQQQQGSAEGSGKADAMLRRYALLLSNLLASADAAADVATALAQAPVTCAAVCEAALRAVAATVTQPQEAGSAARYRYPDSVALVARLAGNMAAAWRDALAIPANSSSGDGASSSRSKRWSVRQQQDVVSLLASCLKVTACVTTDTAGARCAASHAVTVLEAALLLGVLPATTSSSSSSDATSRPLSEQLESGSLSWAVAAARALACIGQARRHRLDTPTEALRRAWEATPGQQLQLVSPPHLVEVCVRAVGELRRLLEQLRPQLPRSQLALCLQAAEGAVAALRAATAAAADSSTAAASEGAAEGAEGSTAEGAHEDSTAPASWGHELQVFGALAASLLPSLVVCNNPGCVSLSGLSERSLVSRARCTSCKLARYCGQACQVAHWAGGDGATGAHKPVCRLLKAGAPAAAAAAARPDSARRRR